MNCISLIVSTLLFILIIPSCKQHSDGAAQYTVRETFMTDRVINEDIDSIALWHDHAHNNWVLISTAKCGNKLYVYDAATGALRHSIGCAGMGQRQFRRPNGIAVLEDTLFIVERDNHRMQAFALPSEKSIAIWAADQLIKPYGISGYIVAPNHYRLYVTDQNPHRAAKQMYIYDVVRTGDGLTVKTVRVFGDESGPGQLHKVESICVDHAHNRVLVSDEHPTQCNIKIYTLEGDFTGQVIGTGIFAYESEGLCVYPTSATNGYIIATDQDRTDNRFHIFDRATLKYLTTFRGNKTINVDGVAITHEPVGGYPHGMFYAVNDDGGISAFDWDEIVATCGLHYQS